MVRHGSGCSRPPTWDGARSLSLLPSPHGRPRGAGTWGLSSWWPWPRLQEAGAVPVRPRLQRGLQRLAEAGTMVHALAPSPPPHRTRRPRKATASLSSSHPTSQGLLSLSLSLTLSRTPPPPPMSHSCSSVKTMSPSLRFPTSPPPSPPPPALGPLQRAPDRFG